MNWLTIVGWYQIPWVHGAVVGLVAAIAVDLREWMAKPGWSDEGFNLALASKRWVVGAITGAGFSAVV